MIGSGNLRWGAPVFLAILCLLLAPARAEETRPVALLELFTSQGCSSCPPADHLISELASDPRLMVLTFAVDYWDYLGWVDTLASPDHTARQKAYALARGDRRVFTPQVIVNGMEPAIGSDRDAIERAVANTAPHKGLFGLAVKMREHEGQIEVDVPASPDARKAEVWLAAFARKRSVSIAKGENASRHMTYVNVVRRMTRLGRWGGKAAHFRVPHSEAVPQDADGYIAIVQEGSGSKPGMLLGLAR